MGDGKQGKERKIERQNRKEQGEREVAWIHSQEEDKFPF